MHQQGHLESLNQITLSDCLYASNGVLVQFGSLLTDKAPFERALFDERRLLCGRHRFTSFLSHSPQIRVYCRQYNKSVYWTNGNTIFQRNIFYQFIYTKIKNIRVNLMSLLISNDTLLSSRDGSKRPILLINRKLGHTSSHPGIMLIKLHLDP